MNKPVNCGCGGEAKVETDHDTIVPGEPIDWKRVICNKCNIRTTWRYTEAEAITAWNRAMGERTAKVEDIQVEWGDDEYINDRMGDMYHYGNCGNCGETVSHNQKYCHHCGARLEWE